MSPEIPFYERDEVAAWISKPEENIFLIGEQDGAIAGFLFCKIMSVHWAMLDNIFVRPSCRRSGVGLSLVTALRRILEEKKIRYISLLTKESNQEAEAAAAKYGFRRQDGYAWWDLLL